jgi:hypothetical protein
MANRTRAQLSTDSATNFPDNTSQLISPQDLRDWITNGIDSFVTQKDISTLTNALWEGKSNSIVAGGTTALNLANGNFIHITGNTTITSFGTVDAGARFILVFDGTPIITYNATSLIIPGNANKTAAAGDCCMIVSEGGGNWRIVGYFPRSGGGGGGSVTAVTASAPLSSTGGTAPDISIPQANGSTDGFLDSGDWTTFNNKQNALGFTPVPDTRTISTTSPITGGGDLTANRTIAITQANSGQDGYLSSTDWATFNGKGSGTVTTSGSPSSGQITKFSGSTSITNATAGTDYLVPPSGTAIQKANSGGALANATAGTDYLAPPSGTAIQKANSGGALANATAGTDYVAPGAATGSGLTMATSRLLGRTTASPNPGAIEEISLTTTGTSGAATLFGGNLNIPQYSGGGGSGTVNSGTSTRLAYYASTGTAVSETTNMAIDNTNGRMNVGGTGVPTARVQAAAGTAANGQVLLTPSVLGSGGLTATTDGMMWYDTTSNNSSLYLRKLYAAATSILTKFITLDRNSDLAIGSSNGIVVADANGSLTKSADLTALGIYAETVGTTIQNSTTPTSLFTTVTGSITLPVNFFAVGKTIRIFASGTYQQTNSSNTCTIALTIGGVSMGSVALQHGNAIGTAVYWEAEWNITCRTSGASGTLQYTSKGILNTTSPTFYFNSAATSSSINTTTTNTIALTGTWSSANASNILITSINYANYIN